MSQFTALSWRCFEKVFNMKYNYICLLTKLQFIFKTNIIQESVIVFFVNHKNTFVLLQMLLNILSQICCTRTGTHAAIQREPKFEILYLDMYTWKTLATRLLLYIMISQKRIYLNSTYTPTILGAQLDLHSHNTGSASPEPFLEHWLICLSFEFTTSVLRRSVCASRH